jgi:hypothetical protein
MFILSEGRRKRILILPYSTKLNKNNETAFLYNQEDQSIDK